MKMQTEEKLTPEEIARSSLLSYIGLQYPKYVAEPAHELIATALEAVEAGRIKRLLISAPPQHGKTMLTSEFFPPWCIGRNPDWKIIAGTYNQTRANEIGTTVRDQFKGSIHKAVFPNCTVNPDIQSTHHIATMQRGHYYGIGLSSTGTGRGADLCLPAETLLQTLIDGEKRTLDIETLYLLQSHKEIKVLAFDHKANKALYKQVITAKRTFTNELYKITTNSGYNIRTTRHHRLFIHGQDYIEAKDIQPGNKLTIRQNKNQQNMHALRKDKNRQRSTMLGMLQLTQKNRYRNHLCMVWKENNKKSLRNTQSNQKRTQGPLLLSQMLADAPCNQKQTQMLNMWKANRKEDTQILLRQMQTNSTSSYQTSKETMSSMYEVLPTTQQSRTILFKKLCKQSTFKMYDWSRKLSLQKWRELRQIISRNAHLYFKTRQCSMCHMQSIYGVINHYKKGLGQTTNTQQLSSTSYKQRSNKQHTRESNNLMYILPYNTPCIKQDPISTIERIITETLPVYDLQVEGTSNFFANNILVHNCLIDDPFKGREDAESKIARAKVMELYKSVLYTRLRPGGRIIIINTRWHLADLTGYVLSNHKQENWVIIDLKAIAEENDILGRKAGEALCPKMYTREMLDRIKEIQGTYNWESLYQQRPIVREGGIIKYEWLEQYYTQPPNKEDVIKTVISWDTAYRPEDTNDPTAATVWQITENGYYLIDVYNEKLEFYKIIKRVKEIDNTYHPSAHLIEGRATGQTLIDELKRTTTIPVIEISTGNIEKGIRLDAVSGLFEARKIWMPERAHWLTETKDQLCLLPSYKYDDIADSISQFLKWVNKPRYVRKPPSKLYWK